MATTNVDANFYITNGSLAADVITTTDSQKVVKIEIGENGVEFNYDNPVIDVTLPIIDSPYKGGSGTPRSRQKNLLRIKRVITVNGWLSEVSGTTALTKRNDLDTLIKYGGVLTVVWGKTSDSSQQTYTGNVIKASIKEGVGEVIGGAGVTIGSASDRHFNVQIQVLVGEDL